MEMSEWAEKEVAIATSKGKENNYCEYWNICAENALKAFKLLCEEKRSGYSIIVTKGILDNLIDGIPLTPIEDTPDIWTRTSSLDKDGKVYYQCKRMLSLFKTEWPDGRVTYSDMDRVIIKIIGQDAVWQNGFITCMIDEILPITMPYSPTSKNFKVFVEKFLFNPENLGYDTIGVLYVDTPDGGEILINRYFKVEKNERIEISKEEYEARKKEAIKNAK